MKKIKHIFFSGFALAFILSCSSIEKRHYMSGYYITSKSNNKKVSVQKNSKKSTLDKNKLSIGPNIKTGQVETPNIEESQINDNSISASTDNSITIPKITKKELIINNDKTEPREKTISQEIKTNTKVDGKINKIKSKNVYDDGDYTTISIIGLILGIMTCIGVFLAPLFGIAAIIVNIKTLKKIKYNTAETNSKAIAMTGFVLGIVGLIIWTIVILFYFVLMLA